MGRAAGQHGGCRAGLLDIWLEKHPGLGFGEVWEGFLEVTPKEMNMPEYSVWQGR